jgi:hypothetical protein
VIYTGQQGDRPDADKPVVAMRNSVAVVVAVHHRPARSTDVHRFGELRQRMPVDVGGQRIPPSLSAGSGFKSGTRTSPTTTPEQTRASPQPVLEPWTSAAERVVGLYQAGRARFVGPLAVAEQPSAALNARTATTAPVNRSMGDLGDESEMHQAAAARTPVTEHAHQTRGETMNEAARADVESACATIMERFEKIKREKGDDAADAFMVEVIEYLERPVLADRAARDA